MTPDLCHTLSSGFATKVIFIQRLYWLSIHCVVWMNSVLFFSEDISLFWERYTPSLKNAIPPTVKTTVMAQHAFKLAKDTATNPLARGQPRRHANSHTEKRLPLAQTYFLQAFYWKLWHKRLNVCLFLHYDVVVFFSLVCCINNSDRS